MKFIKKMSAILLIMTTAVSLCSCGGNKTVRKLDIDREQNITIWYSDNAYTDYLQYVAKQVNKADEYVTVNPVLVENDGYINNIYQESIGGENYPDVYLMSSKDLEKAYLAGLIEENDVYTDDFSDKHYPVTAVTASCYQGKMYGYPVTFNTSVMVYNSKLAGSVDTFDEIEKYQQDYKNNDGNISMITGWDADEFMLNYAFSGNYFHLGGQQSETREAIGIDTDNFKAALTGFYELKNKFGISWKDMKQQDYIDMFNQGKLIYTIIETKDINKIKNDKNVEYGVCKIPAVKSGLTTKSLSETTLAVVNPYTASRETAKAVANAISYDYASDLEKYTGYMTARKDITESKKQKNYTEIYNIYEASDIRSKFIGADGVYQQYEYMLSRIWDGENVDTVVNECFKDNGSEEKNQGNGQVQSLENEQTQSKQQSTTAQTQIAQPPVAE